MTRAWQMAAWICLAGTGFHSATALADDDAIVPPVTAPASPSASPPAFEPGEITIGEPLQVPQARRGCSTS